ncbi:cold-shock protein [Lutimonas sp.]|uniref:cold-shock protein n=1 Tax=Lutimonas sp. TaxID=1872403 RepID=UPI003D9B2C2E
MAKSQQTFNKSEKEKKRLKKREDKRKKMEARKAAAKENGKKGIEFAYVDHNGHLTDTPPDPSKKIQIDAESIEISIPKSVPGEEEEFDPIRKGSVSFFDSSKGFGFIIDAENSEKYFCHVSGLIDEIAENDKVTFELEKGMKGMNAVKVTLIKED